MARRTAAKGVTLESLLRNVRSLEASVENLRVENREMRARIEKIEAPSGGYLRSSLTADFRGGIE